MVIRTMRKPLGARDSQIRSVALHKCTATPFEMKRSYVYWRLINDTRSKAIVLGQTVFNFSACDWERNDTGVTAQYSNYQKHLYPRMLYTVDKDNPDAVPSYETDFAAGTATFLAGLATTTKFDSTISNTYVQANWEYLPLVWHPCGGIANASTWVGASIMAISTESATNSIKIETWAQPSSNDRNTLTSRVTTAGGTSVKWVANARYLGSYHAQIGSGTYVYFLFKSYCGVDSSNLGFRYGYQRVWTSPGSATCYQGLSSSSYYIAAYDRAMYYESHLVPRGMSDSSANGGVKDTYYTFSADTDASLVYRYRNNNTPTNDTSLSFDLSTEADYATVGNPIRYWVLDNWEHPCEFGSRVFHMCELTPDVLYCNVIDSTNNVVSKISVKAVEYAKAALGTELKYFTAVYNYGNVIFVGTNTGLLVFDCHTLVTNNNVQAQETWAFYRYSDYGETYPLKPVGLIGEYLYFIRMNEPRTYTLPINYTLAEDATTHLWRVPINQIMPNKSFTATDSTYNVLNPELFVGYNSYIRV